MNKKAIVAGHICLDITPVFAGKDPIAQIGELLKPGQLIHMEGADVHTGGAVANTGLAMKLLGADVSLMGKIGGDAFGEMVQNVLRKYGAERELIVVPDEATSYSVVLAVPGVDRIFLHDPGANDTFSSADIVEESLREAALFHLGYPPLMRSLYQDSGRELIGILERVKRAGAAISLDMAAVDPASEAGQADWREILRQAMPYLDFFVPSVEELCFMLDRKRFDEWKARAKGGDVTQVLNWQEDVRPLAQQCIEWGAKVLLIKCGAPGLYYRTADRERLEDISPRVALDAASWAVKEGFECSYVPERVLSGTGAGDTSIAAFLTAMLEGSSLEECMHLAAAAGACCVAAYDALSGLLPLDGLREKIRQGWKKQGG